MERNRKRILDEPRPEERRGLFLDRDGVVIEDRNYISDPNNVALIPGINELTSLFESKGWSVVIITNQSGVGRGLFSWDEYEAVTDMMLSKLKPGTLSAIYACGEAPSTSNSEWRKPRPGMLEAAARDLNIDLEESIIVGDRLSDIEAGINAGVSIAVHVLTGHGRKEKASVARLIKEGTQGEKGAEWRSRTEIMQLNNVVEASAALKEWIEEKDIAYKMHQCGRREEV